MRAGYATPSDKARTFEAVYETIERRAATLVIATGIVLPLSGVGGVIGNPSRDSTAVMFMIGLGFLTIALVLALVALVPEEQVTRLARKSQIVFWSYAAFAAGLVVQAVNLAYSSYDVLTGGFP